MAAIIETQTADIRRVVSVVFDDGNCPEYDRRGKRHQLIAARIEFRFKAGEWQEAYTFNGQHRQKLKDESWGKPVWSEIYDRELNLELADEYRPTAVITITETNAAPAAETSAK